MVLGYHPNEVFGSGLPKYTAAESTSDSAVLDNLSINGLLAQHVQKAGRLPLGYPNGLLAQHVQKAGRLPLGYPNGLLAKIEHDFFLWQY